MDDDPDALEAVARARVLDSVGDEAPDRQIRRKSDWLLPAGWSAVDSPSADGGASWRIAGPMAPPLSVRAQTQVRD